MKNAECKSDFGICILTFSFYTSDLFGLGHLM